VWIDCEMTGLDVTCDALIEVAVLVTDPELNVLGDGVDVVISPPVAAVEQMSDFVRAMHASSGLLDSLVGGITLAEAERLIMDYVRAYVPEAGKAPLAGSSVGMDRAFLARDMPIVHDYLHYRNVDVSSIKELTRRWYPKTFFAAPDKASHHRALDDIKESITELRYYREAVFVPSPGPTREAAKAIAARYYNKFSPQSPRRRAG